jgi:hypothetical protein
MIHETVYFRSINVGTWTRASWRLQALRRRRGWGWRIASSTRGPRCCPGDYDWRRVGCPTRWLLVSLCNDNMTRPIVLIDYIVFFIICYEIITWGRLLARNLKAEKTPSKFTISILSFIDIKPGAFFAYIFLVNLRYKQTDNYISTYTIKNS